MLTDILNCIVLIFIIGIIIITLMTCFMIIPYLIMEIDSAWIYCFIGMFLMYMGSRD